MNKEHIKKLMELYKLDEASAIIFYEALKKLPKEILDALFNDSKENISYKDLDLEGIMNKFGIPSFEALIRLGACMISEDAYKATLICVNPEAMNENINEGAN